MRTNSERNNSRQELHRTILATSVAVLGSLCFGYNIGYSSPALLDLQQENSDLHLTKQQGAWFSSLITLGALLSCPVGGCAIDKFGRKATIMLSAVPLEIGLLLITYAHAHAMLYVGRFIAGFGMGMISVAVPTYIAEISPPRLRGALASVHQFTVTAGILFSYIMGVFYHWRILAVVGAAIPALQVALMVFMPETARWFMGHHQRGAAIDSLIWFRGSREKAEAEIGEIEENDLADACHGSLPWREALRILFSKPMLVSTGLMLFLQLCGGIAILFNCADIFKTAGFDDSKAVSVIVAATQLVSNGLPLLIMDRAGRRCLLLVNALVLCLSHIGLGIFFEISYVGKNPPVHHSGIVHSIPSGDISWMAITFLTVFNISFSISWAPIPWVVMGEIFPQRARGLGCSVSTVVAWGGGFLVTWSFTSMQDVFTVAGTYWFYAGCCLVSFFFVYFLVPETKGRSLEEIQTLFNRQSTPYSSINPVL